MRQSRPCVGAYADSSCPGAGHPCDVHSQRLQSVAAETHQSFKSSQLRPEIAWQKDLSQQGLLKFRTLSFLLIMIICCYFTKCGVLCNLAIVIWAHLKSMDHSRLPLLYSSTGDESSKFFTILRACYLQRKFGIQLKYCNV